jgi:hypothetical protein
MMVMLKDYQAFAGRHYETGTIHNALAYQGVKVPHTGKPSSEALLMGISGGATFGYFTFEYGGYLPHIALLTRNTFDPMPTLLERLAIPQDVLQTDNPQKGEANLLEVLESGRPALVWADMFSLPYPNLPYDEHNWFVIPIVVYGYEEGIAYLADRSSHPIKVTTEDLNKARARRKQDKFRVMMLDTPDWNRLPAAVSQSIWQCIRLYTEAPPKGKRDNFGLAALQYWADMLTNTRNKQSWARYFPPGERMWMALAGDIVQPGAFGFIRREAGNSAERGMYADFLDEAAAILKKPALKEAATQFRRSETAWSELADMLLPDEVPLFKEAKEIITRKHALFIEKGSDALDEIRQLNERFKSLQQQAADHFPFDDAQASAFRAGLATQVLKIRDLERDAVECLKSAMV